MKPSLIATTVLVLSMVGLSAMGGCEAQRTIDDLTTANRKLQERVVELQAEVSELNERIRLLKSSGEDVSKELAEVTAERDRLQAELDKLSSTNAQLRAENRRLQAQGRRIPEEVENALKDFASNHPELATYDPTTQGVKFSADLTFALGSAELSDQAKQAIGQLADILNSEAAKGYEVRVVGHTDSVPISRPATREKHPSNWHLSVHRAISVRDALSNAGIGDVRTSVSGYSKYRPVVQNTRTGAQANRRVEVYLVPMGEVNEALIQRTGTEGGAQTSGQTGTTGGTETSGGGGGRSNTERYGPGVLSK